MSSETSKAAEVLAVHRLIGTHEDGALVTFGCSCGNWVPDMGMEMDEAREAHDRHVAAALAPVLAAERAAGARKALMEAADRVGPELASEVGGHTSTYAVRRWLRERASSTPLPLSR